MGRQHVFIEERVMLPHFRERAVAMFGGRKCSEDGNGMDSDGKSVDSEVGACTMIAHVCQQVFGRGREQAQDADEEAIGLVV